MSDDTGSNVINLPTRGGDSGGMPDAPDGGDLFYSEPSGSSPDDGAPPASPEGAARELPAIRGPISPEVALRETGTPDAPEFEEEEYEEGEYEQPRSLADRLGDWLELRLEVARDRHAGEAPFREAEIARKAALLEARTAQETAMMEQNAKFHAAQMKAKSDKAAARGKADASRSSGSGLGAVLAERVLERGDSLVLLAHSTERAHDLRSDLPDATVLVADLADPAAVEAVAGQLPEALDSVVHAAGVVELGPVGSLLAPAVLTRVTLPALRVARGTVVLVNSGAGLVAHPQWSAYAASKFGLRALADSLRAEEQEHGVRVTTVYPGRTATPMQQKVHDQEGKQYDAADWIDPESVVDAILHVLDLPGDATISDLTIRPR